MLLESQISAASAPERLACTWSSTDVAVLSLEKPVRAGVGWGEGESGWGKGGSSSLPKLPSARK